MLTAFDIKEFLKNPHLLGKGTVGDIQKELEKYPYYQILHFLLLKNLLNIQSEEFDKQLHSSIIHISDRAMLYNFLYQSHGDIDEVVESNIRRREKDSMLENISDVLKIQVQQKNQPVSDELILLPDIDFEFDAKSSIYTHSEHIEPIVIDTNFNKSFEIESSVESDADESFVNSLLEEQHVLEESVKIVEIDTNVKSEIENEPIEEEVKQMPVVEKPKRTSNATSYFDINELAGDDFKIESKENDLIAKFLVESPRLEPKMEVVPLSEEVSESGNKIYDDFMTESLAKIYIKQGNFEKALLIFDKLSLKYPEKNSYFAARVEEINKLKNNQ